MALDADITTTGQKQGKFAGQNPVKARAGSSVVTRVDWEIEAPKDHHTGLATGKREHRPVVVEMPLDSAAINYKTAIVNNEVLSTVLINFYQTAAATLGQVGGAGGSGGESKAYYTIELKNAVVQKVQFIHPFTRSLDPEIKNRDLHIKVSFTYQAITTTWTVGGKVFNDDWTAGSQ
jgi:type VI secretion system secreted protein Hcp